MKLLFMLFYWILCVLHFGARVAARIRGTPGLDYPNYSIIPNTSFKCSEQVKIPAFYADLETNCQVFHHCYEHRRESYLCPPGTIFNEAIQACDYWYSSECPTDLSVSTEPIQKYIDEPIKVVVKPSNVFEKMAALYDSNQGNQNDLDSNQSVESSHEFVRTVDFPKSQPYNVNRDILSVIPLSDKIKVKQVDLGNSNYMKYEHDSKIQDLGVIPNKYSSIQDDRYLEENFYFINPVINDNAIDQKDLSGSVIKKTDPEVKNLNEISEDTTINSNLLKQNLNLHTMSNEVFEKRVTNVGFPKKRKIRRKPSYAVIQEEEQNLNEMSSFMQENSGNSYSNTFMHANKLENSLTETSTPVVNLINFKRDKLKENREPLKILNEDNVKESLHPFDINSSSPTDQVTANSISNTNFLEVAPKPKRRKPIIIENHFNEGNVTDFTKNTESVPYDTITEIEGSEETANYNGSEESFEQTLIDIQNLTPHDYEAVNTASNKNFADIKPNRRKPIIIENQYTEKNVVNDFPIIESMLHDEVAEMEQSGETNSDSEESFEHSGEESVSSDSSILDSSTDFADESTTFLESTSFEHSRETEMHLSQPNTEEIFNEVEVNDSNLLKSFEENSENKLENFPFDNTEDYTTETVTDHVTVNIDSSSTNGNNLVVLNSDKIEDYDSNTRVDNFEDKVDSAVEHMTFETLNDDGRWEASEDYRLSPEEIEAYLASMGYTFNDENGEYVTIVYDQESKEIEREVSDDSSKFNVIEDSVDMDYRNNKEQEYTTVHYGSEIYEKDSINDVSENTQDMTTKFMADSSVSQEETVHSYQYETENSDDEQENLYQEENINLDHYNPENTYDNGNEAEYKEDISFDLYDSNNSYKEENINVYQYESDDNNDILEDEIPNIDYNPDFEQQYEYIDNQVNTDEDYRHFEPQSEISTGEETEDTSTILSSTVVLQNQECIPTVLTIGEGSSDRVDEKEFLSHSDNSLKTDIAEESKLSDYLLTTESIYDVFDQSTFNQDELEIQELPNSQENLFSNVEEKHQLDHIESNQEETIDYSISLKDDEQNDQNHVKPEETFETSTLYTDLIETEFEEQNFENSAVDDTSENIVLLSQSFEDSKIDEWNKPSDIESFTPTSFIHELDIPVDSVFHPSSITLPANEFEKNLYLSNLNLNEESIAKHKLNGIFPSTFYKEINDKAVPNNLISNIESNKLGFPTNLPNVDLINLKANFVKAKRSLNQVDLDNSDNLNKDLDFLYASFSDDLKSNTNPQFSQILSGSFPNYGSKFRREKISRLIKLGKNLLAMKRGKLNFIRDYLV